MFKPAGWSLVTVRGPAAAVSPSGVGQGGGPFGRRKICTAKPYMGKVVQTFRRPQFRGLSPPPPPSSAPEGCTGFWKKRGAILHLFLDKIRESEFVVRVSAMLIFSVS